MKPVLFTSSFVKELKKIPQVTKADIFALLAKHPNTNLIIRIDSSPKTDFLKCYLLQKKIRLVVLHNKVKDFYLPISIMKKESKKGKNITSKNYIELFGSSLEKALSNIEQNQFEIFKQDLN